MKSPEVQVSFEEVTTFYLLARQLRQIKYPVEPCFEVGLSLG